MVSAYEFLLLHELFVGAVVHDPLSKHWSGKVLHPNLATHPPQIKCAPTHCVCVFCTDLGDFATKRQIVAFRSESNRHSSPHDDECEQVAILPQNPLATCTLNLESEMADLFTTIK